MKTTLFLGAAVSLLAVSACAQQASPPTQPNTETSAPPTPANALSSLNYEAEKEALARSVGTQAYLFGTALVAQHRFRSQNQRMVAFANKNDPSMFSPSARDGVQFEEILHIMRTSTHEMRIGGSQNVDTRYSGMFLDLSDGPQFLVVPPIEDRFFSIHTTDAYLGNMPFISSKTGDTNGLTIAYTGPGWTGDLPSGVREVKMPQNEAIVVLRILVKDAADTEAVTSIQNGFKLMSLKDGALVPTQPGQDLPILPKLEGLDYFQYMIDAMQAMPPEGEQAFIWHMLSQIGVNQGQPFSVESLDPAFKTGLIEGLEDGKKIIAWRAKERGFQTKNGYRSSYGLGDAKDDYMYRSEWAVQGATSMSDTEALLFNVYTDSMGMALDGTNTYTITIDADHMPPVDAFWSLTSYDTDEFNLIPNEHYHYSVGDRTPSLQKNGDGSVTIFLQPEPPETGMGNWIPTPTAGSFKLLWRFYNPQAVMLDQSAIDAYLPPIVKSEE